MNEWINIPAGRFFGFPELFPFISKCYVQSSKLTTRLNLSTCCITSAEGVQQGDLLGPFLFSLALHPILTKANIHNGNTLTPSYLDDITVLGTKQEVISIYSGLKADMLEIGLELRDENVKHSLPMESRIGICLFQ